MSEIASTEVSEEDSCQICFGGEVAPTIFFIPCKHRACASCVQKLRIANIYKADKGVKCPFCRQTIEGYSDILPLAKPATSAVQRGAAAAGHVLTGLPFPPYGRGGILSIGGQNDYHPPKGITGEDGGFKFYARADDMKEGYIVPPLKPNANLLALATDKTGARHLVYYMRDDNPRRHKAAKQMLEALIPFAARLATHPCGNFVIQQLMAYAAINRGKLGDKHNYTNLVRHMCARDDFVKAAMDSKGVFVLQKLLVLTEGTTELSLIVNAVKGSVAKLAYDNNGTFVMQRLAEICVTSVHPTPRVKARFPVPHAAACLSLMCSELAADEATAVGVATSVHNSLMLVECVRWALPAQQALDAAVRVAGCAAHLAGDRMGHRVLQGLLSLEVAQVADTVVAQLRPVSMALVRDANNGGARLIKSCLASVCLDDMERAAMVDELLDSLPSLVGLPHAADVVAFGLAILPDKLLENRLACVVQLLAKDKLKLNKFAEMIFSNRNVFYVANKPQGGANRIENADGHVSTHAYNVRNASPEHPQTFVAPVQENAASKRSNGSTSHKAPQQPQQQQHPGKGGGTSVKAYRRVKTSQPDILTSHQQANVFEVLSGDSVATLEAEEQQQVAQEGVQYQVDKNLAAAAGESTSHTAGAAREAAVMSPLEDSLGNLSVSALESRGCGRVSDVEQAAVAAASKAGQAGKGAAARRLGICVTCDERPADTVLMNCSHMCVCADCADDAATCPLCSCMIEHCITVHLGPPSSSSAPPPPPPPAVSEAPPVSDDMLQARHGSSSTTSSPHTVASLPSADVASTTRTKSGSLPSPPGYPLWAPPPIMHAAGDLMLPSPGYVFHPHQQHQVQQQQHHHQQLLQQQHLYQQQPLYDQFQAPAAFPIITTFMEEHRSLLTHQLRHHPILHSSSPCLLQTWGEGLHRHPRRLCRGGWYLDQLLIAHRGRTARLDWRLDWRP
eukprot:jgi/Mesen1/4930/ME000246S04155